MINSQYNYVYKSAVSIVAGLACFFISPYGIVVYLDSVKVDFPWAILFPVIISLAWGWRYSLIAAISGGALFPFYLWPKCGIALLGVTIQFFLLYLLVSFVADKRMVKHVSGFNIRLYSVVLFYSLFVFATNSLFYNSLLSLNKSYWIKPNYFSVLPDNIILSFTLKDIINVIFVILASDILLQLPILRRLLFLKYKQQNSYYVIFFSSLIVPLLFWILFAALSVSFLKEKSIYSELNLFALIIVLSNGFIISKILFFFNKRRIITEAQKTKLEFDRNVIEKERKRLIREQENSTYLLNKSFNELNLLYHASKTLNNSNLTFDEVFQNILSIISNGFSKSDVCKVIIRIFDREYIFDNQSEIGYKYEVDIVLEGKMIGEIEVYFNDKGALLFDVIESEKKIIHTIVDLIQAYFHQKQQKDELNRINANLSATINATDMLIWSVDKEFQLLTFNKTFEKVFKEIYTQNFFIGKKIFDFQSDHEFKNVELEWEAKYQETINLGKVTFEKVLSNLLYKFTLSPIYKNNEMIGLLILGLDITVQRANEANLVEANRKIGELKVIALKSAMNPHFLFNALNSIQFFIANNEKLNAINYLSTFSKLIRMVLDSSVADFVPLSQEIDIVKNYVQLEKLRFEEQFDLHIEYGDDLNLDGINIPPLIIQPYIENAILHGFTNSKRKGKMILRIDVIDSFLIFQIEDNGIGREASAKLKGISYAHKSLGTKITEERLGLIQEQSDVNVHYEDLFDTEGPSGTRVNIKMKLQ